ncbi:MAG TPA: DUF4349 domain-containing protein [Pyrinomonadaceae bacterium]|nr:DUF4349 domain-containing protein [Pyrinomonadaceae bacterium]
MKNISLTLILSVLFLPACSKSQDARLAENPALATQSAKVSEQAMNSVAAKTQGSGYMNVSLDDASRAENSLQAANRRVLRNAEMTLEVPSTIETQHTVSVIAESHGGFVVNSESRQRENVEPAKRTVDIKLVVRVPSDQFGATIDQIRQLAVNLPTESLKSDDVTEEFIDLEAHAKTQKALELQFLEIMKQAKKVEEALEVQRQLADVRAEIERIEGRKRFLENRAALSTITVNLQSPTPIVVSSTGFGRSIRDAASDSLDVATGLVLFFVRSVIVMLPVVVLVILPLALVFRFLVRRAKRMRLAQALATPTSN